MAYDLFFDGFEDYSSYTDLNKYGYWTADSWGDQLVSILPTGGRRSGACAKIATAYSGGLIFSITPSTHVVLGLALKMDQTGFYTGPMAIQMLGGGTVNAHLSIQEGQVMSLQAGGISVGSSTETMPDNAWIYLELGLAVANSNGSYEVRVNGSSQGYISGTGDTLNAMASNIDQIKIIGQGGGGVQHQIYVDDMRVTFGDELVWLGDCRVDRPLLTADGTPMDWTPSTGAAWERLNAGDGYVASSVDEQTALFTAADITHDPDVIHGVCARSLLYKSDSGTRETALLIKSGSSESESAAHALTTTSAGYSHTLKTDPATSAAWTVSGVNALQAGVRVKV